MTKIEIKGIILSTHRSDLPRKKGIIFVYEDFTEEEGETIILGELVEIHITEDLNIYAGRNYRNAKYAFCYSLSNPSNLEQVVDALHIEKGLNENLMNINLYIKKYVKPGEEDKDTKIELNIKYTSEHTPYYPRVNKPWHESNNILYIPSTYLGPKK